MLGRRKERKMSNKLLMGLGVVLQALQFLAYLLTSWL